MALRTCEPIVFRVRAGWLAKAPPDFPYRIGVIGSDKDEARRRFTAALVTWGELHDRVENERRAGTVSS